MVRNGCIYLITNDNNGKKYVGQHHNTKPARRFYEHCNSAIKGKSTCILAKAIRKNGVEAFKIETLGIFPHDSLDTMECYYAEQFETYIWDDPKPGYNMVWCGGVGRMRGIKATPETKEKMSKTRTGKTIHDQAFKDALAERNRNREYTEEDRNKLSEIHKGLFTKEIRMKMSESHKKKYEEDEQYRIKNIEGQRKRRQNETEEDKERYRQNTNKQFSTPEAREKQRQTTNKQFSTPEAREKHRQTMLRYYEKKRNEGLTP
jgi:group I intron endonuclease|nr:MAG: hypothetical protein [Lake Baikal virophage 3]